MLNPIRTMFLHFPLRAYTTVLVMVLISAYVYKRLKGSWEENRISRWQGHIRWMLLNYVLLLLFLTVFGRRSQDYYRINLELLDSYRKAFCDNEQLLARQILLNIAAFIPVGFLGTLAPKRFRLPLGLLAGVLLSVFIEGMQYVMRNGYCEADDLVSNTLGTIVGCLLAGICIPALHMIRKRWNPERNN